MNVAVQTAIRVHHLRSSSGHSRSVPTRCSRLVQCAVIVGSALTIEIGDRTLLADASFVVGAGEKVGLVGRNGTGKSSFISVLVGETAPQLRHRGNVRLLGSFGYLPQAPVPGGLGLEPTGFSHILSARGLDVLDDALGTARSGHGRRPLRGEHRAVHRPAGAVPVERRLRGRVGHGPAGRRARAAPGAAARGHRRALGRPAPAGRPHAGPLPGARPDDPRRADQPPRPLRQALAPRRAGPLPRRAPRGQPRPQAARPVHHQGAAHREPAADRVEGQLLEVPGASARPTSPSASGRPSSSSGRSSASRRWPTPCGRAPRSGPARPRRSTGGSSGWRRRGPRSTSASGPARSSCRRRPARAPSRSRWPSWASATATTRCSPRSPSTPAGVTTS